MNIILKNIAAACLTLSLGTTAFAGGLKNFKTEEVKRFEAKISEFGIDGVKLNGLDNLVEARSELRSSFGKLTEEMAKKPDFFKKNKEAVTELVNAINASTGMAAEIFRRKDDGSMKLSTKGDQVLAAIEALPGILATVATGKNGDIARATKVAKILSSVNRENIVTESAETDVLAGKLTGTATAPKTVDDVIMLTEKALNENRADGQKFTLEDLIKRCLEAIRKA